MAKTIKVKLLENVKNRGNKGEIVEVSIPYAQNVLLRQNKAKIADKDTLAKRKARKEKKAKEKQQKIEQIQNFANNMKGQALIIEAKANEKDKLYETIDSKFLSKHIIQNYNVSIPSKAINIEDDKIQKVGKYKLEINYDKIDSIINLEVKSK